MRYVKLSFSPEGIAQPVLRVRYDYEDDDVPQPLDYIMTAVPTPAIFGTSTFSNTIFGASNDPLVRQAVQGGGFSVSFRIRTDDKNPPFSVNGMYIDYMPSTRR